MEEGRTEAVCCGGGSCGSVVAGIVAVVVV